MFTGRKSLGHVERGFAQRAVRPQKRSPLLPAAGLENAESLGYRRKQQATGGAGAIWIEQTELGEVVGGRKTIARCASPGVGVSA